MPVLYPSFNLRGWDSHAHLVFMACSAIIRQAVCVSVCLSMCVLAASASHRLPASSTCVFVPTPPVAMCPCVCLSVSLSLCIIWLMLLPHICRFDAYFVNIHPAIYLARRRRRVCPLQAPRRQVCQRQDSRAVARALLLRTVIGGCTPCGPSAVTF